MLKVNEYFEGQVKSIAFHNEEGDATLGVMEPGTYEFNTTAIEYMTIISGAVSVLLPHFAEYQLFHKGDIFTVPANSTFKIEVLEVTAYLCIYR